ncbi:MAG: flagellar filament capping protein FliD [Campylobacterota bacterium]|nr:flagellar filament capping protein FliD [Campylobacterota bacterium]
MAGEISSLGIGSGVLTAEIIEKLKANDESRIIKPVEDKVELANQKEDALELLSSLMTTFKSSTSALDGDNLYLGRSVSGNTDALTVTAESGSDVQSFSITDIDKAEKDVWNSTALDAKSTPITDLGAGTLTITIDGEDYAVDYTAADSLNDIRDKINESAGEKMTASVLQVGEDSYELIITAENTNEAITYADSNDGSVPTADSLTDLLALNNVQPAEAATFKYNGITVTRDTNEVSDLINGVTLTLNQNETTDSANISISQNETAVTSEMSIFVQNYNNLISNLEDMTTSDIENGVAGIFNGESFIKSISRELNDIILSVNSNGESLVDYGISIDRDGVMSLDNSVLSAKFAKDPEAMELFFSGDSDTDGIFTTLDERMANYTGYNKLLTTFSDGLENSKDSLVEQYDRLKASLDDRYEIMTKRFVAYDAIISRINSQFSSLEMMIQAELNSDN